MKTRKADGDLKLEEFCNLRVNVFMKQDCLGQSRQFFAVTH